MVETKETIQPKEGNWATITDGIREAFDKGYKGPWTFKHHQLIGKSLEIVRIIQLPYKVIGCYVQGSVREYIEFPIDCIQVIEEGIPEGWLPSNKVPPDRKEGSINVFIGIAKREKVPVLTCWINNSWVQYYPLSRPNTPVDIIAYQPILNWPSNWPERG